MSNREKPDWSFTVTELYCMSLENFNLIEILGEGAIGEVHLAEYKINGRLYALKIVKYKHAKKILYGLDICTTFKHENLVSCYGHFSQTYKNKKCIIIIMEFVQGNDLFDIFMENDNNYILFILPTIIQGVIRGLKYMHKKGYIHRDIKLENIILTRDNKIKIVDYDFIIAEDTIDIDSRCGTPYYVSPEILGDNTIDHRTDIWSLGVVLYTLLTRDYPFDGEDEIEVFENILSENPSLNKIPSNYIVIVTGMLQKRLEKRITLKRISKILKGK